MQQYFGIWADFGFALFGLSALVFAAGSVWLRAKRTRKDDRVHAEVEALARLRRIEQIVEASALEIERMTEMQRHASRLLAERGSVPLPDRPPTRIVTPH